MRLRFGVRVSRWVPALGLLLLLGAASLDVASPIAAQPVGAQTREGRLLVTVVTRSDRGKVYCAIWRGPRGYPTQRAHAAGTARDRTIANRRGHCAFAGLEVGADYAVAAFHDENGNDDLDRGLFGIPTEGTGASNDARAFMGPPRYQDARFVLPAVAEHAITITIGYP